MWCGLHRCRVVVCRAGRRCPFLVGCPLVVGVCTVLVVCLASRACAPLCAMLCSVGVFARAKQMLVCHVAPLVERCYTCLWLLSALCWLVVNSGELLPEFFSVGSGGSELFEFIAYLTGLNSNPSGSSNPWVAPQPSGSLAGVREVGIVVCGAGRRCLCLVGCPLVVGVCTVLVVCLASHACSLLCVVLCSVDIFARAKQMLVCRGALLVKRCYTCLWLLSALCWLVVNSGELLPEFFSVCSGGSEVLPRITPLLILAEVLPRSESRVAFLQVLKLFEFIAYLTRLNYNPSGSSDPWVAVRPSGSLAGVREVGSLHLESLLASASVSKASISPEVEECYRLLNKWSYSDLQEGDVRYRFLNNRRPTLTPGKSKCDTHSDSREVE
ncbi:hypothetical protein Taro_038884, partial [Colocasia esculenta]|nr:hypothetical protein [Colocasia esculenta]